MGLKIFLSHSSTYADLAQKLKLSLLALETEQHLDIRLSADMPDGTDWRAWIETNVRAADLFLLLYPHEQMDMGWCNYELGRFHDLQRPVVCLKNTDIAKPPPAFQTEQAYTADTGGLFQTLKELFVQGRFTAGRPLNAEIGNPASDFYTRARDVCNVLADHFAKARVRELLYDRRVVLTLSHDAAGRVDFERSKVHGNAEGLALLGLSEAVATPWSVLRRTLGARGEWLAELEQALPTVPDGTLPPALSPYRSASGIYLPILTRAEVADGNVRQLAVIFVSAGVERLLPLLGWPLPRGAPEGLPYLMQLLRTIFVARWDILEPRLQEALFRHPTPQRRAQLVQEVSQAYQRLQEGFERDGGGGIGRFYNAFQPDLRPEVQACSDEWLKLATQLHGLGEPAEGEPAATLKALHANNTHWLSLVSRQFQHTIANLH